MVRIIEAKLIAKGKKFGILVSRFNDFIGKKLLEGALDALLRHGADENAIDVVWVPGSFEIPAVARQLAKAGHYHGLICLGAVIRGETPHFDYVAAEAAKGIAQVALGADLPLAFGIVTADNLEQAIERAGAKQGNKGAQAALSAIEMANLYEILKKKKR
jgi:6,7-dimethyl-8-ribityllumazine synthase